MIFATLETDILRPSVVERAIRLALDAKPERQQRRVRSPAMERGGG